MTRSMTSAGVHGHVAGVADGTSTTPIERKTAMKTSRTSIN